jgi:hypothetical protein
VQGSVRLFPAPNCNTPYAFETQSLHWYFFGFYQRNTKKQAMKNRRKEAVGQVLYTIKKGLRRYIGVN